MGEFLMPSLGSDMETGTLIEWEKNVGETVTRGDIIAVVETQKGAIEIEVYESGVLESQLVEVGKPVPVGTPLALIGKGSTTPEKRLENEIWSTEENAINQTVASSRLPPSLKHDLPVSDATLKSAQPESENSKPPTIAEIIPTQVEHRQRITPIARRVAAESGVDITRLQGSGPRNAIVLKDVESAKAVGRIKPTDMKDASGKADTTASDNSSANRNSADTAQALARMRTAISSAMTRSKRDIPHYYLSHSADLSRAENWLTRLNASHDPSERVLMGVLFLKAVALAAVKYPEFNGFYSNGVFTSKASVHTGMAINLRGGGLAAPAIHNTDKLDVATLMASLRDLVMRVRAGRFRAAELSDPTITVSSLGERGVKSLYGVIYPPQVCIVGFGTPTFRPSVDGNGELCVRKVVDITLAADHRVSDGHRGALFLGAIQKTLEHPEVL